MKKILTTILIIGSATLCLGNDVNRVKKYLYDRGQTNAINGIDFSLRNDMDERGTYIEKWVYTNTIPLLSQCPSEAVSEIWAEQQRQNDKSIELKEAENNFILLCDALTGSTSHIKVGKPELEAIINNLPINGAMVMTLKLLVCDSDLNRIYLKEGKLNAWWDDCVWHQDIVK